MKIIYRIWWTVFLPLMAFEFLGSLVWMPFHGPEENAPIWFAGFFLAFVLWTGLGVAIAIMQICRAIWNGRHFLDAFD